GGGGAAGVLAAGGGGGGASAGGAPLLAPADTPRPSAQALAASAFWILCRPRSEPTPARSANAPSGPVQGARATSSVPTACQPSANCSRAETRSTQPRPALRRRSAMALDQGSSWPTTARRARPDRRRVHAPECCNG